MIRMAGVEDAAVLDSFFGQLDRGDPLHAV